MASTWQLQLLKIAQWNPVPNKSLLSARRGRACLQQLNIHRWTLPFPLVLRMLKQRAGELLQGIHSPTHAPPCDLAAKQGSQREAAISTGCRGSSLQEQQRQALAAHAGTWAVATRSEQKAAASSTLPCSTGKAQEGLEPMRSHVVTQGLLSWLLQQHFGPCTCFHSSRLGLELQSGSSLYFHHHFPSEHLLFPYTNCHSPEVQMAARSSSKTQEAAIGH